MTDTTTIILTVSQLTWGQVEALEALAAQASPAYVGSVRLLTRGDNQGRGATIAIPAALASAAVRYLQGRDRGDVADLTPDQVDLARRCLAQLLLGQSQADDLGHRLPPRRRPL